MKKRECTKCKQVWELSQFIKKAKRRGGDSPHCQECRDKNNLHNAKWRENNLESRHRAQKAWREKNRAKTRQNMVRWNLRNKDKKAAHNAVKIAVRNGVLMRGDCSICGSTENIHAHHEDYTKPLEVDWFCKHHHREYHKARRHEDEKTQMLLV